MLDFVDVVRGISAFLGTFVHVFGYFNHVQKRFVWLCAVAVRAALVHGPRSRQLLCETNCAQYEPISHVQNLETTFLLLLHLF